MTQKELWQQVAIVYDAFNRINHESKLLDLVSDLTDNFSEDSFDKIALLIDCFKSRLDDDLDNLRVTLGHLESYLQSTQEPDEID